MRKTIFANGEYYHVYNRGVDKREVFSDGEDFMRFLKNLNEFNNGLIREERLILRNMLKTELSSDLEFDSSKNLVDIVAYCLNPNHFHLILKQNSDKGLEKFMHKISTGYTNYFNKKNERSGSLFQGPFKSIHINSNEYLLHLSAYVNKNYFIHGYAKDGEWEFCSELDYLGKRNGKMCKKENILNQFKDNIDYQKFINDNVVHFKNKKELEKFCLE